MATPALAGTDAGSGPSGRGLVPRAVLRTACLYGLAGSAYVAVMAIFRPGALGQPVWHGTAWPHRDTFGAVSFLVSFLAGVTLQWTGDGMVGP
jgi:hypothetical protein